MPKLRHFDHLNTARFITFSCYRRLKLLSAEPVILAFLETLQSIRLQHHIRIFGYVIMPEHVHLLICPQKPDYSISKILLSIKQSVSRKAIIYLRKHNPPGLKHLGLELS